MESKFETKNKITFNILFMSNIIYKYANFIMIKELNNMPLNVAECEVITFNEEPIASVNVPKSGLDQEANEHHYETVPYDLNCENIPDYPK